MPLLLPIIALIVGLIILVWSADLFVDGAAASAYHAGMSTLLIGMVVVGFGTSAPELVVSVFSSAGGNPGLALGNAFGSNISNIGLILGLTAIVCPIRVKSGVLRKELPILLIATLCIAGLLHDLYLSRMDAMTLLGIFLLVMGGWVLIAFKARNDTLEGDFDVQLEVDPMPLKSALIRLLIGVVLLVASSRVLVWGAVEIAYSFGISDLVIGLTIVAIGTSLPELASAVVATRKGEHDLALGNVIGSNLFNSLAVIGLAGVIHPLEIAPEALYRDCFLMGAMTVTLFFFGYGFRGRQGRINRIEGTVLLLIYLGYSGYLLSHVIKAV